MAPKGRHGGGRAGVGAPGLPRDHGRRHAIEDELRVVEEMSLDQLRVEWHRRWRDDPPSIRTRDILMRLVAWRMQVEVFGDIKPETKRALQRLKESCGRSVQKPGLSLKTGTILIREWQGTVHRVLVTEDGFLYDEKKYRSLSEIARTITGSRWSGPRFFGLEDKQAQTPEPRS